MIRYDVKLVKNNQNIKNFISTIGLRKVRKHILNGIIVWVEKRLIVQQRENSFSCISFWILCFYLWFHHFLFYVVFFCRNLTQINVFLQFWCFYNKTLPIVGPFFKLSFILLSSHLIFHSWNDSLKIFESFLKLLVMASTLNCISGHYELWHFLKYLKISKII